MSREPGQLHSSSNWVVETAHHPALPSLEVGRLKASFWESFLHSHKVMFALNNKMGKKGKTFGDLHDVRTFFLADRMF